MVRLGLFVMALGAVLLAAGCGSNTTINPTLPQLVLSDVRTGQPLPRTADKVWHLASVNQMVRASAPTTRGGLALGELMVSVYPVQGESTSTAQFDYGDDRNEFVIHKTGDYTVALIVGTDGEHASRVLGEARLRVQPAPVQP